MRRVPDALGVGLPVAVLQSGGQGQVVLVYPEQPQQSPVSHTLFVDGLVVGAEQPDVVAHPAHGRGLRRAGRRALDGPRPRLARAALEIHWCRSEKFSVVGDEWKGKAGVEIFLIDREVVVRVGAGLLRAIGQRPVERGPRDPGLAVHARADDDRVHVDEVGSQPLEQIPQPRPVAHVVVAGHFQRRAARRGAEDNVAAAAPEVLHPLRCAVAFGAAAEKFDLQRRVQSSVAHGGQAGL